MTDAEIEGCKNRILKKDIHDKDDKRLIIMDEEFRQWAGLHKAGGQHPFNGHTLFLGFRRLFAAYQKNPITAKASAHQHHHPHNHAGACRYALLRFRRLTVSETGFYGYARGVPSLSRCQLQCRNMTFAPIQREMWRLTATAQKRGAITMSPDCLEYWQSICPGFVKGEHTGLVGNIINRAEAQTIRLALAYALLDGKRHNQSAAFAGSACNVEICRNIRAVHIWRQNR